MCKQIKYPYQPGKISTKQAVEFIANVVSFDGSAINSRKSVRERIRYGRKKGEVSVSEPFDAIDFFQWAVQQSKWGELINVEGLPLPPVVGNSNCVLPSITGRGIGVTIPNNTEELRGGYVHLSVENRMLLEEVIDLRKRNAELETEVAERRAQDRLRREKFSLAGKMGGRGKTK